MSLAAAALIAVWLVLTLGVRVVLQVRRTGDTGLRPSLGPAFSIEWWAGVGFVVSLVTLAAATLVEPLDSLTSPPVQVVGVVLTVLGIAATFGAQLAMGASWRIGVDPDEHTDLVAVGPFRWVRNPIFSAMGLTAAGLSLMVPNAVAFAALALLVAALELQVRGVEEPYLRATHGESYRRYTSEVGRFVPGLGRTG